MSEAAAIGYALTGCREKVARQAAEIERLKAEIERRDEGIAQQVLAQKIEIERLRAYKTEIEHWIEIGERIIGLRPSGVRAET